jgi:hypothetical protein
VKWAGDRNRDSAGFPADLLLVIASLPCLSETGQNSLSEVIRRSAKLISIFTDRISGG